MRGAEIVAMTAGEISEEPDGLWWTVPKHKTKNARHANATDVNIPLIGRAAVIVAGACSMRKAAIYSHRLAAVHYHQPYSKTRPEAMRPRLSVTYWAPHDLRRSTRTLLAAVGCPDLVAESVLGHMQPGIRGVYNRHAYEKDAGSGSYNLTLALKPW